MPFNYQSETGDLIENNGVTSRLITMVICCGYGGAIGLLANGSVVEHELHNNKVREDFYNKIVPCFVVPTVLTLVD